MNVILYIKKLAEKCETSLLRAVESEVPDEKLEIIRSFKTLSERLYRIPKQIAILVLHAADRRQLSELISLSELMEDLRIILVLPDREGQTFSKGHILRPRFLTYTGHGYDDLAAVLRKMLLSGGLSSQQ